MTDDNPLQDRRGAFFALLAVTLVRIPIALTFALLLIFIDHGPVLLVSASGDAVALGERGAGDAGDRILVRRLLAAAQSAPCAQQERRERSPI